MPVATIDVGTNTALLLIADRDEAGRLTPQYQARRFVRLGEGVDASGEINPGALRRLRDALLYYKQTARTWKADPIVVAATSASRDAQNQAEVRAMVERDVGLAYEILSGQDEARWTFAGAVAAFDDLPLDRDCLVIDIGGGSTELVHGRPGTVPSAQHSLDVGAVRLTERLLPTQPATDHARAAARALVRRMLSETGLHLAAETPLVAASGTVMILALLHHGASAWDDLAPHQTSLSVAEVEAWSSRLAAMTYDEVLALNPLLMEGRADVFPAGVLICETLMHDYGFATCRVSPWGLRHGLALRYWYEESKDLPSAES
ncbi:MAG: exopolyphosphatase [Bacteroidota bacterium]